MGSKQGLAHYEQVVPKDHIARSDGEVSFPNLPFAPPLINLQIEKEAGEILLTVNYKDGGGSNITDLRLAKDGRVSTFNSGSQLTYLHI